MPIIFFATMFSASISLAFLWGLIVLQNYQHSLSKASPNSIDTPRNSIKNLPTLGGLAFVLAQALTLYIFGWHEALSQTYLLGLGVFGALGLICDLTNHYSPSTYLPELIAFLSYLSILWCSPALQSSETWIPFFGMCRISPWISIGLNGLVVMGTLQAMRRINKVDGLVVSIMLPLWSLLFIFFSHTAFGALWAWPYGNLNLIAGINLGSLAAFTALNGHPALIIMGRCGALALAGGVALLFCALKCPLIVIGLLFLPALEILASLTQWVSTRLYARPNVLVFSILQYLEYKGYHVNIITLIYCICNTVIAGGTLKLIHLLWL